MGLGPKDRVALHLALLSRSWMKIGLLMSTLDGPVLHWEQGEQFLNWFLWATTSDLSLVGAQNYKSLRCLSSPCMGLGPKDRDTPDLAILSRGWKKMGLLTSTVNCPVNHWKHGKPIFDWLIWVTKHGLRLRCCGHPKF